MTVETVIIRKRKKEKIYIDFYSRSVNEGAQNLTYLFLILNIYCCQGYVGVYVYVCMYIYVCTRKLEKLEIYKLFISSRNLIKVSLDKNCSFLFPVGRFVLIGRNHAWSLNTKFKIYGQMNIILKILICVSTYFNWYSSIKISYKHLIKKTYIKFGEITTLTFQRIQYFRNVQ